MPPFQSGVFWAAIGANVLYLVAVVLFQPKLEHVYGTIAVLYIVAMIWVVGRRVALAWRLRVAVRVLRQFDPPRRARILAELDDEPTQAYLERRVDEHGGPTVSGSVERFEFSPVDRRELTVAAWCALVTAWAVLLPVIALQTTGVLRGLALTSAALLAVLGIMLRSSASRTRRAFEVSPFGLSEVKWDGSVRRVPWTPEMALRNRPWLRRIEVSVANGGLIEIPYSVIGFTRLVEIIAARAGFERRE